MTSDCKSRRREISTNPRLLWMLNNFSLVSQIVAWASSGGIYSGKCLHIKGENKVLKQTLWLDFKLVCYPLQPWICPTMYLTIFFFCYNFDYLKEIWKKLKQIFFSSFQSETLRFRLWPFSFLLMKKFSRLWWERNTLIVSTNTKARNKTWNNGFRVYQEEDEKLHHFRPYLVLMVSTVV